MLRVKTSRNMIFYLKPKESFLFEKTEDATNKKSSIAVFKSMFKMLVCVPVSHISANTTEGMIHSVIFVYVSCHVASYVVSHCATLCCVTACVILYHNTVCCVMSKCGVLSWFIMHYDWCDYKDFIPLDCWTLLTRLACVICFNDKRWKSDMTTHAMNKNSHWLLIKTSGVKSSHNHVTLRNIADLSAVLEFCW